MSSGSSAAGIAFTPHRRAYDGEGRRLAVGASIALAVHLLVVPLLPVPDRDPVVRQVPIVVAVRTAVPFEPGAPAVEAGDITNVTVEPIDPSSPVIPPVAPVDPGAITTGVSETADLGGTADPEAAPEPAVHKTQAPEEPPAAGPTFAERSAAAPATHARSPWSSGGSRGQSEPLNGTAGGTTTIITLDPVRVVEPEYPPDARVRGQEGTIVLAIEVGSRGRVAAVRVVESSGFELLDTAALRAARLWRFPREYRGVTSTHRFSFRLAAE